MLPDELIGTAGLNLEFLPSAYFGKIFSIDGDNILFPHYPSGPTKIKDEGEDSSRTDWKRQEDNTCT